MEKLSHEKKIDEHEWTILTDKAVIQEKESLFGNLSYTEIPIEKIDSISRNHIFKNVFLIFAFIFIVLGAYNYINQNSSQISLYFIGLAFISILLYFFTAKKELIIKAGNETIYENAKGAGKFVNKLREQIYK